MVFYGAVYCVQKGGGTRVLQGLYKGPRLNPHQEQDTLWPGFKRHATKCSPFCWQGGKEDPRKNPGQARYKQGTPGMAKAIRKGLLVTSWKQKPAKLNNQPILKRWKSEREKSWSTKRRLQEKSPSGLENGPSIEKKCRYHPKKGQPDGESQENWPKQQSTIEW